MNEKSLISNRGKHKVTQRFLLCISSLQQNIVSTCLLFGFIHINFPTTGWMTSSGHGHQLMSNEVLTIHIPITPLLHLLRHQLPSIHPTKEPMITHLASAPQGRVAAYASFQTASSWSCRGIQVCSGWSCLTDLCAVWSLARSTRSSHCTEVL